MARRSDSPAAISHERLLQILRYDPETGEWTWLFRPDRPARFNNRWAGRRASSVHTGDAVVIRADGKIYYANVLAWFYMTGSWPEHEVDHRDLDRSNNRWSNLRHATRSQNQGNVGPQSNNKLGIKGVFKKGRRFIAKIQCQGGQQTIGIFDCPYEAGAAYRKRAIALFGEFARS